ncbi:hypothetical protein SE23_10700 [Vibrio sinaloensis]|uniref:DUF2986 domain-containing protein n=1 Tax=Photobacterium sp. (strain ATCC 43367) TaxID=379097 RepID=UPI000580755D|nr:DUF2986 domain-containing protein [Vibrio sinaloensis]KIE20659.1 hypothetical protein SE23_10700 [Vibrio sinaloensis]
MNRKKKINSILKAKLKKKNAKLHKSNKPRYISKAERAKLESEDNTEQTSTELSEHEPTSADSSEQ